MHYPYAVRARSVFKYLLAGLLVSLLVINSQALPTNSQRRSLSLVDPTLDGLELRAPAGKKAVAKKAPVKAAPAKKGKVAPAKKAPAKKTKTPAKKQKTLAKKPGPKTPASKKTKVPAKAGAACPKKASPNKKSSKGSLYKRAGPVEHPSAASSITLFHGTASKDAAISAATPDLSKTWDTGDHHLRGQGCDGGFYLTDSLFAAAQYVCYKYPPSGATNAYVNEYLWTPPTGLKHKRYPEVSEALRVQAKQDCKAYDLLEGPMNNPDADSALHKDFYQYTITNQGSVSGLTFVKRHKVPCKAVQKGKSLPSELYQQGQKSNPHFAEYVKALDNSDCVIA